MQMELFGWALRACTRDVVPGLLVLAAILAPGTTVAATTTYTDEASFLGALAAAGHSAMSEGFEDAAAWGAVRTTIGVTNTAPSVTNLGITWAPNSSGSGVTTSSGPARSGSWGFFELPHGNYSDPLNPITDGFIATTVAPVAGFGGWFSGQGTSTQVCFVLDGVRSVGFNIQALGSQHQFLGVIDTQPFIAVEVTEQEGTAADQNLVFADDITFAVPGSSLATCGNATLELGEQCDDGNILNGDCCAADCSFETAVCNDGDICTTGDACSGGACVAGAPLDCDDGNACTDDSCSVGSGCINTNNTAACDDGNACTAADTCAAGICTGTAVPSCATTTTTTSSTSTTTTSTTLASTSCETFAASTCLGARASKLKLNRGKRTAKNKLKWKWNKGDEFFHAELGTPTTTDAYELCLYDTTAQLSILVTSLVIPTTTKWQDKRPQGFKYQDPERVADGVQMAKLKPGRPAKSMVQVTARGANIPMPAALSAFIYFDQDPDVIVKLVSSSGICWVSTFKQADSKKNTATHFSANTR